MAMGVYCDSCKHKELEHKFDKWPCMDCCDGDRRDPVRNADRIRAMTDEELAEYLAPCACPPIRFNKNTGDIVCPVNKEPCESDCKSCWLDWLKEEATQNDS